MNDSPNYADLVQAGFPLEVLVQKASHEVIMSAEEDGLAPSGHSILILDDYDYEGVDGNMHWTMNTTIVDMWSCEDSC